MDTLNQGKEDKNKDIIENNNKNNSGNRNTKSAQFKVAFITQAAVIAALYVVLVVYPDGSEYHFLFDGYNYRKMPLWND